MKYGRDASDDDELDSTGDERIDERFLISLRLGHGGIVPSCGQSGRTL